MDDTEFDEDKVQVNHTDESDLALYVESNLNKKSYSLIATDCRLRGFKYLPSYPFLQKAMANCTPANINCLEVEAVVPVQNMLNIPSGNNFLIKLCKTVPKCAKVCQTVEN